MPTLNEARDLWIKNPNNQTAQILDRVVAWNLRRQRALNWLWLRANKHDRHAELLQPETQDLKDLLEEIENTADHFAQMYQDDLRQVLARRAQLVRELIYRIDELKRPRDEEEQMVLQDIIVPRQ